MQTYSNIVQAHLDPNIKSLVEELNIRGYYTLASCAGNHLRIPKWEQDSRGYLWFKHRVKVKTLLRSFGLKRIKTDIFEGGTHITFTGLGGTSAHWHVLDMTWPQEWISRNPTPAEELQRYKERMSSYYEYKKGECVIECSQY